MHQVIGGKGIWMLKQNGFGQHSAADILFTKSNGVHGGLSIVRTIEPELEGAHANQVARFDPNLRASCEAGSVEHGASPTIKVAQPHVPFAGALVGAPDQRRMSAADR